MRFLHHHDPRCRTVGLHGARQFQVGLFLLPGLLGVAALFFAHANVSGTKAVDNPAREQKMVDALQRHEPIIDRLSNTDYPELPHINSQELTISSGGLPELQNVLEQNVARPLSLAAADFDEDGMPDLLSGYEYQQLGIVTLRRGDIEVVHSNSVEAQVGGRGTGDWQSRATAKTDAAFFAGAEVFALPSGPDFLGAGDFNADGHQDIVAATRGGSSLYFLLGDGRAHFGHAEEIPLSGVITAFVTGEINRADGLADIAVGVLRNNAAQALVFEGPEGAMRTAPESFALPANATALALGEFDGRSEKDLAVAAGTEVVLILGRDRKLSLNTGEQSKVAEATVEHRTMPYLISALAAGDFLWDSAHHTDIALLDANGVAHFFSFDAGSFKSSGDSFRSSSAESRTSKVSWSEQQTFSLLAQFSSPQTIVSRGSVLLTAHVSARQTDELLFFAPGQSQIQLVNADPAARNETGNLLRADDATEPIISTLNATTSPVAVLPMRLSSAALDGLVVLRSGNVAPTILATIPGAIITVNSTADSNTRDSVLTLREAILLSNGGTSATGGLSKSELMPAEQAQVEGTPGANQLDEIRFNIANASQSIADPSARAVASSASESQQESDSHQWQSVRGSNPTYLAADAEWERSPMGVAGLLRSGVSHPFKLDLESSTGFRRYRLEWRPQSSGVSQYNLPAHADGTQLATVSYLGESGGLSTARAAAESLQAFSCTTPSFGAPNTISLGDAGTRPQSIAIGDFNLDGKRDVVTANANSNNITVLLGNGAGGFGAPHVIRLGAGASGPYSVAIGDFNGDGKSDLVTANLNSSNITVLLGTGSGDFGTPTRFSLGAVVSGVRSVSTGDFNGDSKADVVTSNAMSNSLTVLLGNGTSGFGLPRTLSLGAGASFPNAVAVADLNRDGKLDLITANSSNSISVFLGNGAGGFGIPNPISLGADVNGPLFLAVGDFNGDATLDVVTANVNSNNISILLGDGTGGFATSDTVNVAAGTNFPLSVAIGDFNGDGKPDLVTANLFSNSISLFLGNGDGHFAMPNKIGLGVGINAPIFVAVGDFDGDGDPDIVTANSNSNNISMLLGNGAGSFGAPNTIRLGFGASGPVSVAIGDLNSDGKPDIVATNYSSNSISVLLGNGGGSFGTPNTTDLGAGASAGLNDAVIGDFNGDGKQDVVTANVDSGNITLLLGDGGGGFGKPVNIGLGPGTSIPYHLAIGDFNRDGKPDVVATNLGSNYVTVLLGNGAGGFGIPTQITLGAGVDGPYHVAIGDLNVDGKQDVVTTNINSNNISVLLGNGTGGFGPPSTISLGAGANRTEPIAIADFNRDGKLDLVTANILPSNVIVLLGNGTGGFGPPTTFGLGPGATGPEYLAVGDLNGDGNADVVTANNFFSPTITVLSGNGTGGFDMPNTFYLGTDVSPPGSIAFADFDGDGKPDVVTANVLSNNLTVLLNTCGTTGMAPDLALSKNHVGNFTVGVNGLYGLTVTNVGTGSTSGAVTVTDTLPTGLSFAGYDGVGWACSESGQTVTCTNPIRLPPTTTLSLDLVVSVDGSNVGTSTSSATVATQGAQNIDSASASISGCSVPTFGPPNTIDLGLGAVSLVSVALGDINGDGRLDAVTANLSSSNVTVLLGDDTGGFAVHDLIALGPDSSQPNQILLADLNGDGKSDIITINDPATSKTFSAANLSVLLGDGVGQFGQPQTISLGSNARSAGSLKLGDFNADGKLDVLTLTTSYSGPDRISVLLGNGTGGFSIPTTISLSAEMNDAVSVVTGDFNGDGKLDFITAISAFGSPSGLTLMTGNGAGSFKASGFTALNAGEDVSALATSDFNNDGFLDTATTMSLPDGTTSISVRLGGGTGSFGSPIMSPVGKISFGGIVIGDFDGDGRLDLIAPGSSSSPASLTLMVGNGNGSFGSAVAIALGTIPSRTVALGDVNGDGKLDIMVVNNDPDNLKVLLNISGISFSSPITTNLEAGAVDPYDGAVGDLNHDGKLDMVIVNALSNNLTVLLANGTGGFGPPKVVGFGAPYSYPSSQTVALGDFNGDSKLDAVAVSEGSKNVVLLLGDGAGGFGSSTSASVGANGASPTSMAIADFNRDGKSDVVTCGYFSRAVTVLLGNGNGGFSSPISSSLGPDASGPFSLAVADFNSDGKPDVATANTSTDNLTVLWGDGTGNFQSPTAVSLGPDASGPISVAVGSFRGTGNRDLVAVFIGSSNITVVLNNNDGTFGPPTIIDAKGGGDSVTVGDLNGDGKADIISTTNVITVIPGNGDGTFGAPIEINPGGDVRPFHVFLGDFTGDGRPDVVTTNLIANNITVMNNTCGVAGISPELEVIPTNATAFNSNSFTVGTEGLYQFTVTNVGTGSTTAPITLTDSAPPGLRFPFFGSDGKWTCRGMPAVGVTCTHLALLPPTASTTMFLYVDVQPAAVPSVTNTARVSTPGDLNSGNDEGSVTTKVGLPCISQGINLGQSISGSLSGSDCFSPINQKSPRADRFSFSGTKGQAIAISLTSTEFDAFIYLVGPDGAVLASDDDGGRGTNSRIPSGNGFFILPSDGTYTIEATTDQPDRTGNYVLSLTTGQRGCSYDLSSKTQTYSGAQSNGTINVFAPGGCAWTSDTNAGFITISSGASGSGDGVVNFTLAANNGTTTRSGTLTIAGQTLTVFQEVGSSCTATINKTSNSFAAVGGSGTVAVAAPAGCSWTVASNDSFIKVNGNSGSGVGLAHFTVLNNTKPSPRAGQLSIAGNVFNVTQGGTTSGIRTITLQTPLPKITDAVVIDGTTQPGYAGSPLVEINGSNLDVVGGGNGLNITAGNSTIRGLTLNRFSSRNREGAILLITNGNNIVESCYIGTDPTGTQPAEDIGTGSGLASGIYIRNSNGNLIGGTTGAARNLISGIDGSGITLEEAHNNLIRGNYIGTDVSGSASVTIQRKGVFGLSASGNQIGGTTAGAGNLLSGNGDYGVQLLSNVTGNLVQGNLIGTNAAGTARLANGNAGVFVSDPSVMAAITREMVAALDQVATGNNTIGGTTVAARNVVSGNEPYGVVLGVGAVSTQVQGNYIGTDTSGMSALSNTYGVTATQATGSTIGGATAAARNVISGNTLTGVSIGFLNNGQLGGTGTTIEGNYIGTSASGTGALGNQADGVFVEVQSITHTVQNNLIAFNGSNGVRIPDATSNPGTPGVRIQIVGNSIFSNAGLAIDLGTAGITANDALDVDGGANLLQNFPVLMPIAQAAVRQSDALASELVTSNPAATGKPIGPEANATVSGTLNSTPNTTFTVHWYFSADSACAANQASSRPLVTGRIPNVITNGSGNAGFNIPLEFPVGINNGIINCTATDPQGNTSEYSACLLVSSAAPQWQPVALTGQQIAEMKAWTVGGRTYVYVKPQFPDAGYRVTDWGQTGRSGNDFTVNANVEKFSGASIHSVVTTAQIYDLGPLANGTYNFNFKTAGTLAKALQFTVSSIVAPANPIDDARQFVKQQYRDFLNREADQAGEDFWTDNITKCNDPARRPPGQTVEQCTLRQRETTSGAFFVSPEFQYTGYYVYRMYQGALGRQPKLSEFIPDVQFVGNGIIVNGQLSGAQINQNKAAFAAQFVNCVDATKHRCAEFKAIYDSLTNQQYVDKLFQTTGVNASGSDRAALVNGLNANPATETRASVVQKVVDGINVISEGNQQFTTTYGQAFYNAEFNRAFVQLEYFGYMKRDPDEAGYGFWLDKLNTFGGNFVNAEMVLAFISSPEYRARFGQP